MRGQKEVFVGFPPLPRLFRTPTSVLRTGARAPALPLYRNHSIISQLLQLLFLHSIMFARISRRLLPSLRGQSARTATTTTTFYPSSRLSSETGTRTAGIIYPAKGRMIFPTISNSSTGAYNSVVPNVSSTSSSSFTAALPHLLVNSTGVNALGRQTRGCAVVGTSLNQTRSVWQEVIRQVPSDDPNKVGKLTFEDPDLADTRMVRAMRAEGERWDV